MLRISSCQYYVVWNLIHCRGKPDVQYGLGCRVVAVLDEELYEIHISSLSCRSPWQQSASRVDPCRSWGCRAGAMLDKDPCEVRISARRCRRLMRRRTGSMGNCERSIFPLADTSCRGQRILVQGCRVGTTLDEEACEIRMTILRCLM